MKGKGFEFKILIIKDGSYIKKWSVSISYLYVSIESSNQKLND